MMERQNLREWLVESLEVNSGKASIVDVCRYVWEKYEDELKNLGDLFFTWQYDIRWVATQLRDEGVLQSVDKSPKGVWELVK